MSGMGQKEETEPDYILVQNFIHVFYVCVCTLNIYLTLLDM